MASRELPAALPHGKLREVFDDIFFVIGSVRMPGPLPMRFSRNMVVLRDGDSLTLVHSMRLNEEGLKQLDALGKVEHVVRLAGFHGMDDAFYKDRYDAKVWAVKGHVYAPGFTNTTAKPKDNYFEADVYMDEDTPLPIGDASLVTFECLAGEGILRLDREGGILITGDSLQNWGETNEYFTWMAKAAMRMLGFIKPHAVGPGWLKQAKPNLGQLREVLDLDFAHVLPVHGDPVVGNARDKYRPAIERATA